MMRLLLLDDRHAKYTLIWIGLYQVFNITVELLFSDRHTASPQD